MITERCPRSGARRVEYERSDLMKKLIVPKDDRLRELALAIESAMNCGDCAPVRSACTAFLAEAARFYEVSQPKIRVLAARPLRVYETGKTELFGDYDLVSKVIRVWMRTAVQHRVTSFGTFLSTLCHEFCHHLDVQRFDLATTPHTRGFYERTALLYHNCRGTPLRPLVWRLNAQKCWQIDWSRMRPQKP